ncbi:ATP-binding protein [Hymenobacter psoromatis]|uniref:ATP-binding protein n=1 Tax=Hymenobacter psoromatis TaxID=1484116 RepID=UPI001CC089DB
MYVPGGQWLARKENGKLVRDTPWEIIIEDDGHGMSTEEVNAFFLTIGGERRNDRKRGPKSRVFGRDVMGRKGVGKLAPFGICEKVEVWTAGGESIKGDDGKEYYQVSNFIMDINNIMSPTDAPYYPDLGKEDGTLAEHTGTRITLADFARRQVPEIKSMQRQLAQRFGITSPNWRLELYDNAAGDTTAHEVGKFAVKTMKHTKIRFEAPTGTASAEEGKLALRYALDPDGEENQGIEAGFTYGGRVYPIAGWMAYSDQSYRDDLMAGVRIYCRGKIAAQTNLFNKKSGFTGEFQVRSYLVGYLEADWLDEEEDLIQTDRKDILWSEELGQQFEKWGQRVVSSIGSLSLEPMREKMLMVFNDTSDVNNQIQHAYPGPEQGQIRQQARELATMFAQRMREDEVRNPISIQATINTVIMLAPHITLDDQLRKAAAAVDTQFSMVSGILQIAQIAELSSFGSIASKRIDIIDKLHNLKDDHTVDEDQLQALLEEAPWLVDPQWAPVTSNKSLATVRKRFEEFYFHKTGEEISLSRLDNDGRKRKRPDFVLLEEERSIQLVEIKKPGHEFDNTDMARLVNYFEYMDEFMNDPGNQSFLRGYGNSYQITLVCDGTKLTSVSKRAYEELVTNGRLIQHNWSAFLTRTQRVHRDFIEEAQRQKLFVSQRIHPEVPMLDIAQVTAALMPRPQTDESAPNVITDEPIA